MSSAHPTISRAHVWNRHAVPALLVFAVPAVVLASSHLDLVIASTFFFKSTGVWVGAKSWLVNDFIHTGGRWTIRIVIGIALAVWLATFFIPSLREIRRAASYLVSALVLTVGVVGLLKTITNVDCPWDLTAFGGHSPYLGIFSPRPHGLPRAHCFPAAHASSGYALMALYFLAYERDRRLARIGLMVGLVVGLVFGFAQQARGAHFISHDLWSALLAWLIPLTLYVFVFDARLYAASSRCMLPASQASHRFSLGPARQQPEPSAHSLRG